MMKAQKNKSEMDHGILADLVSYYVRLVQIAAFKDFEKSAKRYGGAPRYFGLLCLVEANPGTSQGKLAEAIHLVRSSIVPILDGLERDGLIERRSSPTDRRAKSLWLTPAGKKIVGQLKPLVYEHEKRLLARFSSEEKRHLLQALKRIDANLRAASGHAEAAA